MKKTFKIFTTLFAITISFWACNQNQKAEDTATQIQDSTQQKEPVKSNERKYYGDCEGIDNSYGENSVATAAVRLLRKKVGPRSSYEFFSDGPVEIRSNCRFIVPIKAQADIGEPWEKLNVRVAWDGKEFYLD
jgi:hypothetical protein